MKKEIDIVKSVMEQIEKEDIKIVPRYYFVFKSVAVKIIFTTVTFLALYFANLTIFKFRFYQPFGYLEFGTYGFTALIESLPWLILLYTFSTLFVLYLSLVKFKFFYQINYSKVFAVSMFLLIVGGKTLDMTGVNETLRSSGALPIFYNGVFYSDKWLMGKIIEFDTNLKYIVVLTPNNEVETVKWNQSTKLPSGLKFEVGDTVQMIGEEKDNIFWATGISIR